MKNIKTYIRELFYHKHRIKSIWFNRGLIFVNFIFLFLLFWEFTEPENLDLQYLELGFGIFFAIELTLRCWVSKDKWGGIFSFYRFLDLLIIASIFTRVFFWEGDILLLHIFGGLRILRFYRMLDEIFRTKDALTQRRELITAVTNLFVFVFFMTSVTYALQVEKNENINSYLDALYFTMATLTTTGFGDITVVGSDGKILAVLIMIFGVGLFLNVATQIFKPRKVFYKCESCGLFRHERDASHCKHCGEILHILSDGEVGI